MSVPLHVAVAIITNHRNEVLISLRSKTAHQGGLWEFPGGKLEAGESALDALKREIHEELNIVIHKASVFKTIHHHYSDKNVLLEFWCIESFSGKPLGAEGQKIKWQSVHNLNEEEFPMANRAIIRSLKLPQRYMITGSFVDHLDFELKLKSSLEKGISLVQLRCKQISTQEYKKLVGISVSLCKKYNAILLLNTTVEIFSEVQAHGLHLSSQMLSSMQSRPVNDNVLLSVSCHTEGEIEKAKLFNADIILLSPVKATQSHPGVEGIGWEKFKLLSSNINSPVYALGGMGEADMVDARSSGAQGVAAISSFWLS
jgi:8-oxo-dGTP diphosphatase